MNHLLLITDDDSVALSLKVILRDGFLVEETKPSSAISVIARRRPSVVFLDSCLRNADSMVLLKELICQDPTLTVIKLVDSFGRLGKESLDAGAYEVVEKPFEQERILNLAKRAVERERLMQERNSDMGQEAACSPGNLVTEQGREVFFHDLFQTIAENFPDMRKIGMDVLRTLRRTFCFNTVILFLREGETFSPCVSLGADQAVTMNLNVPSSHAIIRFFMGKNRVFDSMSRKDVSFECANLMALLNSRLAFPLKTVNGKLIGFLAAGEKSTGQDISLGETIFLNMVADYLAAIFDNSSLYGEISLQKDYHEAIFKNIPAGVIGVDGEGRVIIFNPCAEEMFGMEARRIKGQKIEEAGSQVADFFRRALMTGETFSRREVRYLPRNILLGISVNVMKNSNDPVQGAVAIFQDLTRIKEMEEREKSVERSRYWTLLASRLSHELKNPLVAIKTFSQMLPAKYDDPEFRSDFSAVVQDEIGKINEIIEKINRLADSTELNNEKVDIMQLFREVSDVFSRKTGMKVLIRGSEEFHVSGDVLKLKEAIGYALDFILEDAGEKGELSVSASAVGGSARLEMLENGGNIEFGSHEDFFLPFSPAIKSPVSIGIALARKILESHGGSFLFDILPEGRKLTFSLPLCDLNGQDSHSG